MRKRDVDIKVTMINIFMVVGILLFLGSINLSYSNVLAGGTVTWGVIGISLLTFSIIMKILYNKNKAIHQKNSNRELLEDVISDGVIEDHEVDKIKNMKF